MNLQELVDYRDTCIACNRKMILEHNSSLKLKVYHSSWAGMRISSKHKGGILITLNHDGTYTTGKKKYPIYNEQINIIKRCSSCDFDPTPPRQIVHKARSVGMTTMTAALNMYMGSTLNNVKKPGCSYLLTLKLDSCSNKYEMVLCSEYVRYCDKESFWHLNTNFDKASTINHGRYDQSFNEILKLTLPPINLSKVKTSEQFINKMKLYTLFS